MFPAITEVKVVLSREKHRRTAALTLMAKGHTFRSEETAGDLDDGGRPWRWRRSRGKCAEAKDRVKNRKARSAPRP